MNPIKINEIIPAEPVSQIGLTFSIIAALDNNNGLGTPFKTWHFKKDLVYFNKITKGHIVIMGKNTYISIGKPLKDRINIVLSTSLFNDNNDIIYMSNMKDLLLYLNTIKNRKIFIIGGNMLYKEFLKLKIVSKIYFTNISGNFDCDTYLDIKMKDFKLVYSLAEQDIDLITNKQYNLSFDEYEYINKEETKFLETIQKIINKGVYNLDRSEVGTLSIFGKSFKYDIRNYRLPLFTHRKIFLKGIICELLFFISGKTDTKILEEQGVNIWKGHTSREFLDSRGLTNYKEGLYGPAYGYQLRHFNAEYKGDNIDYIGQGFDQLEYIINLIKNNPTSRRILFTYWNPSILDKVPLPSCHLLYQFHVNIDTNELSCSFYQRSNDAILANCFNICSASILVFILCKICNLKPGKIIQNVGSLHLYMNQLEVTKEILKNKPYNFPLLYINDPNNEIKKIEDFKLKHFKLLFYKSYKKYNIPFSV